MPFTFLFMIIPSTIVSSGGLYRKNKTLMYMGIAMLLLSLVIPFSILFLFTGILTFYLIIMGIRRKDLVIIGMGISLLLIFLFVFYHFTIGSPEKID